MLGVQNTHYPHSLDQIHTFAFTEDMHSCSKPSQGKQGTVHKVLPAHTHQASQRHWDEAKPSTHQWKPVCVHVHKQAGSWQHSWPSLGQPSAALHLHCQEHVHYETSTSLHVWTQQSHVGVRSNPGEKPSVKLCSRLS